MKRKFSARWFRFIMNFVPCIRGSGGHVTEISDDYTRLVVKLPLSWRTRNIVGTIYGGSMYSSTDPMFMLMLLNILGDDYVVWDKGCTIRFRRPAKKTLTVEFLITPDQIAEIKKSVSENGETTFTWSVAYKDDGDITYVEFDKVLYVANKDFYKEKLSLREKRA